tara:strand:- start:77 stop:646 length:570 start_codon:yes stop_codon:yes gene_type:complete
MNNILMNRFLIFMFGLIVLTSLTLQKPNVIDSTKDEGIVKQNVLKWADSVFYFHEEYRFEQFHAFYTEEYQIALLRSEMYGDKLVNLEKLKSKGFYKKTDAEYEKEHSDLVLKNKGLKNTADNFENKAEYYEILFWSNIKTNHGITVYYSHSVKLNDGYQVTSAKIKSAIGKKNDKTEILYSKDIKKKK